MTHQKTETMGGVPVPTDDELKKMHAGRYILHACRGTLNQVPVEKVKLPGQLGEEGGAIAMGPDGALYVGRRTLVCKSTDGGRTWESYKHAPELTFSFLQILGDGTFLGVTHDRPDGQFNQDSRVHVWASKDEGRTCQKITDIKLPTDRFTKVHGLRSLPATGADPVVPGKAIRY